MKIRFEANECHCYLFDYSTGKSIMLGDCNELVRAKGPNLLDVSITNRCNRCCDFCYRHSNLLGEDITLEDYQIVIENAKECGVQQIAIGGGEPTIHPDFCEILEMTRINGIIPNYSTNGQNLTDRILRYTKNNCGAVAISIYEEIEEYREIIKRIVSYGIKVNLHLILRADKMKKYTSFLKNPPEWFTDLNALIFLNYKPANGNDSLCLKKCCSRTIEDFFAAVSEFDLCGIGFDTCSASYVCKYLDVDSCYYDWCEGARKSAYINEKLEVYPCSFYKSGVDSLRKNSLKWIWDNSQAFVSHRQSVTFVKGVCEKSEDCHATCPIYPISVCDV